MSKEIIVIIENNELVGDKQTRSKIIDRSIAKIKELILKSGPESFDTKSFDEELVNLPYEFEDGELIEFRNNVYEALIAGVKTQFLNSICTPIKEATIKTKPIRKCNGGFCYLVKNSSGLVKIGITQNKNNRLLTIENSLKERLEDVHFSEKTNAFRNIEKHLHRKFKPNRVSGEWFSISFQEALDALNEAIQSLQIQKQLTAA